MANFEYSNAALNVKNKFFRAKAIVYVEGDDDYLFWREIFQKNSNEKFEFEKVGGKKEIKKFIEKLENDEVNYIVAADSDLDFKKSYKSNLIIYSYGHSIENTIYTSKLISDLCNSYLKGNFLDVEWCDEWLERNAAKLTPLIKLDIANELAQTGVKIFGNSCDQFIGGKFSCEISEEKVNNFYSKKVLEIPENFINEADEIISLLFDRNDVKYYIRGHLISSLTHKVINSRAKLIRKNVAISNESLYAAAIMGIKVHFNKKHPHFAYYAEKISNILKYL